MGEWDIKNNADILDLEAQYIYNGMLISAEDAGNIHYGYVGSVLYTKSILRLGAGANQASKGIFWEYAEYCFDTPRDYEMVGYGMYLYELGGIQ